MLALDESKPVKATGNSKSNCYRATRGITGPSRDGVVADFSGEEVASGGFGFYGLC
jgi:hypothetical protein